MENPKPLKTAAELAMERFSKPIEPEKENIEASPEKTQDRTFEEIGQEKMAKINEKATDFGKMTREFLMGALKKADELGFTDTKLLKTGSKVLYHALAVPDMYKSADNKGEELVEFIREKIGEGADTAEVWMNKKVADVIEAGKMKGLEALGKVKAPFERVAHKFSEIKDRVTAKKEAIAQQKEVIMAAKEKLAEIKRSPGLFAFA